jgi:prepilin-type N-terminal cleavage/methylation domain-containing protein
MLYDLVIQQLSRGQSNMVLQNIKNLRKKESGFTIVELLIVIVIIGILAALVIVAYTGIQNRAKTTRANTNATALQKKLEAYYADDTLGNGVYPLTSATVTSMGGTASIAGTGIVVSATAPINGNGQTNLQYWTCSAGQGYQIKYFDYTTGVISTNVLTGGGQASCTAA